MNSLRAAFDFACVAVPKLFGGLCLVLLNISLMNWLGRDAYGVYALCLAVLSLLSEGLFGAAVDMGVLRLAPLYLDTDGTRAMQIEKAAWRLKMQVVGGLSLVLVVASVPVSQFVFHNTGDWHLIVITCAAALGTLSLGSALLHLQIRGYFFQYGLLDGLQILVKFGGIAAALYIATLSQSPLRLGYVLIWFAAAPIIASGLLLVTAGRTWMLDPAQSDNGSRGELWAFIKWFLLTFLVAALIAKMDVFLITTYGSLDEVGVYAAGQTIALIPVLLGSYLSVVFSPKVMPACRDGSFYGLLCRVQVTLIAISIVGYTCLLWNREWVTGLLPSQFASSSQVIFILLPANLAGMTSYPLAIAFLMFMRPRFLVTVDLILFPFLLLAYLIWVPSHGAVGAAVVTAGFGILKTGIAQVETFRLARKSPPPSVA